MSARVAGPRVRPVRRRLLSKLAGWPPTSRVKNFTYIRIQDVLSDWRYVCGRLCKYVKPIDEEKQDRQYVPRADSMQYVQKLQRKDDENNVN